MRRCITEEWDSLWRDRSPAPSTPSESPMTDNPEPAQVPASGERPPADPPKRIYLDQWGGAWQEPNNHPMRTTTEYIRADLVPQPSTIPEDDFWTWLPRAYRDGDKGDEPKFTKWNMEVAFHAGQEAALRSIPDAGTK